MCATPICSGITPARDCCSQRHWGLGASEIAKALKIGCWIYFQWPVLDWRLVRFEKADFVILWTINASTEEPQ
jgi:hypothetical protein